MTQCLVPQRFFASSHVTNNDPDEFCGTRIPNLEKGSEFVSVEKRLNHAPSCGSSWDLISENMYGSERQNHFSIPFELCHDHFLRKCQFNTKLNDF